MAYRYFNPNPSGKRVGDCVVRGISMVTGKSWAEVYMEICMTGYRMNDMPSSNAVWSAYLSSIGFTRETIPCCPTVIDFCNEHPTGTYILGTGSHIVAVESGDYYDAWDSGFETPVYCWERTNNGV